MVSGVFYGEEKGSCEEENGEEESGEEEEGGLE